MLPVITQGAGPLTRQLLKTDLQSWTPAELNATDADTASGSLTWSVSSAASNGTAIVSGSGASPQLLLINRMQILMVLITSICE